MRLIRRRERPRRAGRSGAPRWSAFLLLTALAGPLRADSGAEATVPPLPARGTQPLQAQVAEVVEDLGLAGAVSRGRLALALVQLDDHGRPVGLALFNGHRMMYAASLPKIAILYGVAVALDEGRVTLDPKLREDAIAMIRSSCNPCATRVLERIGREWLLGLLQDGPHRFYDPELGGGLWVGKDYARRGAFRRDPLHGLSHGATAWQVARFYYLLVNGELASEEQTALMLEALSEPAIRHKFVRGLEGRETERMLRKSGTWRQHHSDSVMVAASGRAYILVAMAESDRGGRWLEELAPRLHDLVVKADGPG